MSRRFDRDSKYNSIGRSNVGSDVFEFMDTNSTHKCDGWDCGPGKDSDKKPKADKNEDRTTTTTINRSDMPSHDINILEIDVYDKELIDTPCGTPVKEKK